VPVVDQLLNLPLRMAFAVRRSRFLARESRPREVLDFSISDTGRPIHVLVAGAGLAEGYGVRTQRTALQGQVGVGLVSRTGRGVVVASRIRPALPLQEVVAFLGPGAARGQDVVVFAPSLLDMTWAATVRWHTELFRIVEFLRSTGGPEVSIVLTGLPEPRRNGLLERIARRDAQAANRAMRDVARSFDRVDFVPAPSFTTLRARGGSFDERYYVRLADAIVERLASRLAPR
jgi:hypothetical protein